MVSEEGIDIAPTYDLLSTAVYSTLAIAVDPARAIWPKVDLALALPGATKFCDVSRQVILDTGKAFGLDKNTIVRRVDQLTTRIVSAGDDIYHAIEKENEALSDAARVAFAGELRLLRAILKIIVKDMVDRIQEH